MTDSFLAAVARQIMNDHPNSCDNVLVVFNNRRAGLFLQRELQLLGDKPFFLPRIIGIDDLVNELGGLTVVPNEFLLFELYDIHCSKTKNPEAFEDFISLGEMMLNDFSEIDLYNVKAASLLGNLYDLKQLGEWNLDEKQQTDFQKKYLEFYNSLFSYYTELRKRLSSNGEAYSGMAYRNVADNIENLSKNLKEEFVYFVGFNALSVCESKIISHFEHENRGKLICDGDLYYFTDTIQEAGRFLRQNADCHRINTNFGQHFATVNKTIHIVNCPENVLQTKTAGSIIGNATQGEWGNNCAIVLADEKLLLPMLNSMPESINAVNVTMGLPYSISGIHYMVCNILALFANRRNNKFNHVDIVNIFSDSIISRLVDDKNSHHIVSTKLYEEKTIYASADELRHLTEQLPGAEQLMFIFECDGEVSSILSMLLHLVKIINESGCLSSVVREMEALACLLQIIKHLEKIRGRHDIIQHIDILQRIYLRLAKRRSIALYGEPLKNMQLLGMLETRNLDFDRIIILSVNEGTLPAGRTSNSLIPFNLKRAFGLPTHEEKDAVYAYNFYRLIQRAHEVWLLYSSDSEGMGKGEPSRFIMQILNEMAPQLPNLKIDILSADTENLCNDSFGIMHAPKDERTLQKLKQIATKGFSPSALNRYRNCPLLFYYEDVIGVHEQEELSEEVESNELGTFIHELLCDIYSRDTDRIIRQETLKKALNELPDTIEKNFRDNLLKGRSDTGKNHLYIEVAKTELQRFLEKEIEKLKNHSIQMLLTDGLPIKQQLPLCQPYTQYPVYINGITDRVDLFDGQLRIADYKSGGVDEDDLKMRKDFDSPRDPSDKWFQVLTYSWLYCRNSGYKGPFECGIFPLRSLSSDFMKASWAGSTLLCSSHIDQFETILSNLISEILDPQIDFRADPKKNACTYCAFKNTCGKTT